MYRAKNASVGLWCREEESNLRPRPSYHYRFHGPLRVCGLDYPLAVSPDDDLGSARLVSTPSRFRAWLGIAILQGSPNLSGANLPVSRQVGKSTKGVLYL